MQSQRPSGRISIDMRIQDSIYRYLTDWSWNRFEWWTLTERNEPASWNRQEDKY